MIGYDKYSINHELLLALTLEERTGVLTHDRAKPAHPHTLSGVTLPVWGSLANGLPYIAFDPSVNPGWLECPAGDTGDLNFTTGDFSLAIWVNMSDLTANRMLFCRGFLDADGWYMAILMDGNIYFVTNQAVHQETISADGDVVVGTYCLVGMTRHLASVQLYKNGVDVTETPGAHIHPLTSARDLHIGVYDNETGSPLYGQIAGGPCGPRIWGKAFSPTEWVQIFDVEKHWLGV